MKLLRTNTTRQSSPAPRRGRASSSRHPPPSAARVVAAATASRLDGRNVHACGARRCRRTQRLWLFLCIAIIEAAARRIRLPGAIRRPGLCGMAVDWSVAAALPRDRYGARCAHVVALRRSCGAVPLLCGATRVRWGRPTGWWARCCRGTPPAVARVPKGVGARAAMFSHPRRRGGCRRLRHARRSGGATPAATPLPTPPPPWRCAVVHGGWPRAGVSLLCPCRGAPVSDGRARVGPRRR